MGYYSYLGIIGVLHEYQGSAKSNAVIDIDPKENVAGLACVVIPKTNNPNNIYNVCTRNSTNNKPAECSY